MQKSLQLVAIMTIALTGMVHLIIAPQHFSHAPAHGLFFGALGLAQLIWAGLFWREPNRPLYDIGMSLSGGIILLWLLTELAVAPFSDHAHPVDWSLIVTKLSETVALLSLMGLTMPTKKVLAEGLALAVIASLALWGSGLALQQVAPQLGQGSAPHEHNAAETAPHEHNTAETTPGPETSSEHAHTEDTPHLHATTSITATPHAHTEDTPHLHATTSITATPHAHTEGTPHLHATTSITATPHVHATTSVTTTPHVHATTSVTTTPHVHATTSVTTTPHVHNETTPHATADGHTHDDNADHNHDDDADHNHDDDGGDDGHDHSTPTPFPTPLPTREGEFTWHLPAGFPRPQVPADNPMTEAKVELGRYIFYDKRLSGNGTFSCESCHFQDKAFTDGKALAIGATGQTHPRNSQSLVNIGYYSALTWANPVVTELERQHLVPMFGEFPVELGMTGHEEEVLNRFKTDSMYQRMFQAAYPNDTNPINLSNLVKALASFNRSLISGNSAYDRYISQKNDTLLSESAKRGMEMFFSEDLECHHCHTGFNFTLSTKHEFTTEPTQAFHNTGLYNIDGLGGYPRGNTGIHELTGKPEDMGRFRAPTLRNIALTAPYMHDGSMATLEEVIRFYARGGRLIESGENAGDGRLSPLKSGAVAGFTLTDEQIADLVAFLKSLTDEEFIHNPRLSNPFHQIYLPVVMKP